MRNRRQANAPMIADVETLETRSLLSAASVAGLWMPRAEIMAKPTSGAAWDAMLSASKGDQSLSIKNQNDNADVNILAKAIVSVRLGDESGQQAVRNSIMAAIGTEDGGRTLALARNLPALISAASIVVLTPEQDARFSSWLSAVRTKTLSGKTLISTHEKRPNNWGTHAGAARMAIDLYIGDTADLARAVAVFKGWLGEAPYSGFKFGSLAFQADKSNPRAVNPDGSLPDELRRGKSAGWSYSWEALQGATVQAELLFRAGYSDVYSWGNSAIRRANQFLVDRGHAASGDDRWQAFIVDARYGTHFASTASGGWYGKNMGWTAWTHKG